MTTYKEIFGKPVKVLSSDPANETEGQIWYNTTDNAFKTVVAAGAWSSGTNLPVATFQAGAAGVQTASLMFGGTSPPSQPQKTALTVEYNGSGWSPGGSLNVPRTAVSGAGTQTAALGAGGYKFPGDTGQAEEYNGSAWTNVTSMPTADSYSSSGTQTAALYVTSGTTLEYDGTNWTGGGSLNTPRDEAATAGTITAGLFFGGGPQTAGSDKTEEYNGSTWTAVNTMNTARGIQIGGSGIQTSALAFGGAAPNEPAVSAATEAYDGTTWTTQGNLATAKYRNMAKGGSTSADSTTAISMGGLTNPITDATEEYNFTANTVIGAAWSAGGALNRIIEILTLVLERKQQEQYLVAPSTNGTTPSPAGSIENYNGSSWTNGPNLGTKRTRLGGLGTQTAALGFGGYSNPPNIPTTTATEEYDGSSWTAGGALNTARNGVTGAGTQTASLAFGGGTNTEAYNGTAWTAVNALNTTRAYAARAGTQTAALASGSHPGSAVVESWDGTNWTAVE